MVYNAWCIQPYTCTKFGKGYVGGINKHRSKFYFDVEHTEFLCCRVPFYLLRMPSVKPLQFTYHMFWKQAPFRWLKKKAFCYVICSVTGTTQFLTSLFILYLHRAHNKVTQLANQHMHSFNFLFIKTYLKFLKTLLHVSFIQPSSESL